MYRVFYDARAAIRESEVDETQATELCEFFELLEYNLLCVYRSHIVRNSHQRRVRSMLVALITATSCIFLADYMMKYLALIPFETKSDWFGKVTVCGMNCTDACRTIILN
jgi:hypothetical protein